MSIDFPSLGISFIMVHHGSVLILFVGSLLNWRRHLVVLQPLLFEQLPLHLSFIAALLHLVRDGPWPHVSFPQVQGSIRSLPQLSISIPQKTGPPSEKKLTITFSVLDGF